MDNENIQNKYYTTKQIAEMYGVSTLTVRTWIRNGELSAMLIGKGYRVKEKDLVLFEQSRRILAPSKRNKGSVGARSGSR